MGALAKRLAREAYNDWVTNRKRDQVERVKFQESAALRERDQRRLQILRDLDCLMRIRDQFEGLSLELREAIEDGVLYVRRHNSEGDTFEYDRIARLREELARIDPTVTPKSVARRESDARRRRTRRAA